MSEQTSRLAIVIDSSGAEKKADSLVVALDKMTQSGDKAVATITKVSRATDDEKAALDKLRAAIDPVGAAINTIGRRFSELKKYFDKGLIDEEEFRSLSKMLNDTTEELSGVAQAQREAEKAGKLAAAQQEAQAQSFQRMLDKIDPLTAALRNLEQQQSDLNTALESGKINPAQYDSYSKKLLETRREVAGEAQAEREAAKAHDEQVAALRRLEAQIDPVGEAFRRLSEQQRQLDSAKASGMLSPLAYDRLNSKLSESRDALEKTQTQLGRTGQSAAQTANAMRMIPAQMTDIVVGLSTGQSPFMVLMQQGGQLKDMFGGIGPAIKGVGSVESGTIKVKKLIAGSIESDSLPVDKKPLAKRLADVNHIIGFGQSLKAGINAMPLQTVTAILNAYRFNGGARAQDGSGTSAENHASLIPYIETTHDTGDGIGYETPMGGAITAIFDRLSAEAEGYASGDVKILGSVPAQGSKTIAQLRQNPGPYMQRIIDDMTYGKARANELGLTYSPHALIYMGNESDQTAGTTEDAYIDSFDKMIAAINGFASDVTGKAESLPWFIYQFNSWKNRTPNTDYPTIPLALLKLARTRNDVRLVQPMYMYDYADNAHLLGFDSHICGYRFGLAIEQEMLTGHKFEPLWSKDVILQGGIGNVFYNPVAGLALDTSIVTDPGNYGVSLVDPDNNPLVLTEVSARLDRLRVRASSGIPSGSKLHLGFTGGTTGTLPSRTNGPRCCLRDNQGNTIKFDPDGIAYRLDNYAIVEEIILN